MMALLQMLNDGRLRVEGFLPACKFGVVLSIQGLVTAMRLSTMCMLAFEAGCDRSRMNLLYPLPFRSKTSAACVAALATAWEGFR